MYVYVINDKAVELEAHVMSRFDDAGLACAFIEEKLESPNDYKVTDFQVIRGQSFGVKEVIKRKIYLTDIL